MMSRASSGHQTHWRRTWAHSKVSRFSYALTVFVAPRAIRSPGTRVIRWLQTKRRFRPFCLGFNGNHTLALALEPGSRWPSPGVPAEKDRPTLVNRVSSIPSRRNTVSAGVFATR
jgi:hypothetical protein